MTPYRAAGYRQPGWRSLTCACLLALALWCGLVASAQAQTNGHGYVGYQYPVSGNCSPVCTGAAVTVTIPKTFSGSSTVFAWIGITAPGTGTTICSDCLGQFGFGYTSGSLYIWWEMACGGGGSACNSVEHVSGLTVSLGDTLTLYMSCASNCTGSSSETWTLTLTDITTGGVCYMHTASTCGTSGVTFNWPLSLSNIIYYVYEVDGIVSWTPTGKFSGAMYATGSPGSQTWLPIPMPPNSALWSQGSGAGASKSVSPSPPMNGNDFNICSPVVAVGLTPCTISPYPLANAMGN